MRKLLTDSFVKGIKPTDKRQMIMDAKSEHLRLVVHPTGRKVWTWLGNVAGKRTTLTFGVYPGKSITEARDWATEIDVANIGGLPIPGLEKPDAEANDEPAENKPPEIVKDVDWLWELYVKKQGPTLGVRTLAERERVYAKDIKPAIGSKLIHEVHRDDLVKILRDKEEAGFGTMSNNLCAYIKRLFRWAVTGGYDLTKMENDPAANLIKLAPVKSRNRFLDDDEIGYFFQALPAVEETFGETLLVALYTGMRRSEVFGLEWSEVHWKDKAILIPEKRIKNGLPLVLPLAPTIVAILEARKARTGNYVYVWPATRSWSLDDETDEAGNEIDETKVTNNFSRPVKALNAACQKLAAKDGKVMKHFTIHDLRRTLSSGMHGLKDDKRRSLIPTDVVERVINHAIGGVRGVYNRHDYFVEKEEALSLWAQHLDKIRTSVGGASQRNQTEATATLDCSPAPA